MRMKHSPHQGFSLHSTLISAQHKNVANKQMKESKTSERKKYSNEFNLSLVFFVSYSQHDIML